MKKLFVLTFLFLVQLCWGQNFTVSSDKNNVLFAGIENPITVVVQDVLPESLIVKTNNGKLSGNNGHYIFYTDTGSVANIVVYKKTKNGVQVIGMYPFRIRNHPDPEAKVGGRKGGKIYSAEIRNQSSITSDTETFYFEKGLPIVSFTLCIIRDNKYLHPEIKNIGNKFNEEVKNALSQVQSGDSVIFKDIFATRHDQTTTILSNLTFLVTD